MRFRRGGRAGRPVLEWHRMRYPRARRFLDWSALSRPHAPRTPSTSGHRGSPGVMQPWRDECNRPSITVMTESASSIDGRRGLTFQYGIGTGEGGLICRSGCTRHHTGAPVARAHDEPGVRRRASAAPGIASAGDDDAEKTDEERIAAEAVDVQRSSSRRSTPRRGTRWAPLRGGRDRDPAQSRTDQGAGGDRRVLEKRPGHDRGSRVW